jgi:hypothetical protein
VVTNSCVHLVKQVAGINVPSLRTPKPSEPYCSAQLKRAGTLLARHFYRLLEAGLSFLLVSCSEQQIAARGQRPRLPEALGAVC